MSRFDGTRVNLWNRKCLQKFQWSNQGTGDRLEMIKSKKENAPYLNLIEKGGKIDNMERKREKN